MVYLGSLIRPHTRRGQRFDCRGRERRRVPQTHDNSVLQSGGSMTPDESGNYSLSSVAAGNSTVTASVTANQSARTQTVVATDSAGEHRRHGLQSNLKTDCWSDGHNFWRPRGSSRDHEHDLVPFFLPSASAKNQLTVACNPVGGLRTVVVLEPYS